MHQVLFTPWRNAYVSGQGKTVNKPDNNGCFFCAAAQDSDPPENLVVHRTAHHLVMLNRHPYNSGHLMVAPLEHTGDPAAASPAASGEFWSVILKAREVLAEAYSPDGFNLGMNLGSAAGAGVPGHFHFHLVPRWQGDANFMGVVGDVRLVPEDLADAHLRLRRIFNDREDAAVEQAQEP